jgi:hypothetical protein
MGLTCRRAAAARRRGAALMTKLAGSPLGVTEAIMLAHGFTNATLDALVREGLATPRRRGHFGARSETASRPASWCFIL